MFQHITLHSGLVWLGLLAGLILINELLRVSKWFSVLFFIVIPVVLTFTLWPEAALLSKTNDWFHWAKLYSVIAAAIGFTAMRYTKLGDNKIMKFFPVFILAINILEAVLRDFEVGGGGAMSDVIPVAGGMYNYMNGIAGIFSIITLCGWSGIFIDKTHKSDMLWPDMTIYWIIAYDVWNFAYIYNCIPTSAFFGLAVLLACTIPCVFIKKGTWVQARAFTLTAWMMLLFTFPVFFQSDASVTYANESTMPNMIISGLSLLLNGAFFVYHFRKIFKFKKFGWGQEIHTDTKNSIEVHAMAVKV